MFKKGDNIDWNYKSNVLDVYKMWEELKRKMKSIIVNIPEVIVKFSKQGDPLRNDLGSVIGYFVKEKDKAWERIWNCPKYRKLLKYFK